MPFPLWLATSRAQGLVETSAGYFENEAARQIATAPYLKHFLGGAAGNSVTLYSDQEKYQPDGIRTTALEGLLPRFAPVATMW
jgi:hypothetical protein